MTPVRGIEISSEFRRSHRASQIDIDVIAIFNRYGLIGKLRNNYLAKINQKKIENKFRFFFLR